MAYEIGYKRPPKSGQFKKGRSGNPKGRPKGSNNFLTILEQELGQSIVVNENGRKKKITRLQAMVKRMVAGALQGEHRSLLTLIEVLRRTGRFEDTSVDSLLARQLRSHSRFVCGPAPESRQPQDFNHQEGLEGLIMNNNNKDIYFAALRSDLRVFLLQSFDTLYPGKQFLDNWHIDAVLHCLEQSIEGRCPRLIINLPPRQLKSFIVSVVLPAFLLVWIRRSRSSASATPTNWPRRSRATSSVSSRVTGTDGYLPMSGRPR